MLRKIGDKVNIRSDLKPGMGTREDNCVVDDMFAYAGIETVITRILEEGKAYCVECDNGMVLD